MKFRYSLFAVILLWFGFSLDVNSQTIYEVINSDIHNFLDRINIKGVIKLDNEVKPFTRKYIAEKLYELTKIKNHLNEVERDELNWYLKEYSYEINQLTANRSQLIAGVTQPTQGSPFPMPRWRLYSYEDSLFQLQVSPVAGYEISNYGGAEGHARWWGVRAFGTFGSWFGAQIHFTDNGEFGDDVNREKFFTPERGRETIGVKNGIEYSDVRGAVNVDWEWGRLSLIKDYTSWGNSYFGNLILSDKAPSFTQLRLEIKPVDWFRFYYVHGWLTSNVIDSLRSQYNYGIFKSDAEVFVPKYFAANFATFSLKEWIDVSIGNSIVYSGDSFRPEMLIPFMFFKYLDRDLGKGSVEDGNGQMYFDVAVKPLDKFYLYGSLFFDVIEIRKTFGAGNANNWFGYTVGGKTVNVLLDNLDFTAEYTRVNPWVYEHKDITTTYKHVDYTLGHWIGQNADMLRLQFDYRPLRSLQLSLFYERLRKGGLDDITEGYNGDGPQKEFLYGTLRRDNYIGINITYNPLHELYVKVKYKYSDITDEESGRTPDYLLGENHSFSVSVSYGWR